MFRLGYTDSASVYADGTSKVHAFDVPMAFIGFHPTQPRALFWAGNPPDRRPVWVDPRTSDVTAISLPEPLGTPNFDGLTVVVLGDWWGYMLFAAGAVRVYGPELDKPLLEHRHDGAILSAAPIGFITYDAKSVPTLHRLRGSPAAMALEAQVIATPGVRFKKAKLYARMWRGRAYVLSTKPAAWFAL